MNIVVTRERGHNESLAVWLPPDATVHEVPLTTTRFYDGALVAGDLNSLPNYGSFGSLVVTSARSVAYVSLALGALASGAEVFSVGPVTTRALIERGVGVTTQAAGVAADLASDVSRGPVLVLGATSMRDDLVVALRARGLIVAVVACYETVATPPDDEGERRLREADVVVIGAPSAWAVAASFIGPQVWVVVPGATTSAAVRERHERVLEGWGPSLAARLATL
jgi:uroporphyrinogen-III synthase